MWEELKTDWVPSDVPTADDFSRIEKNIKRIKDLLDGVIVYGMAES
jgi:hypothetical protein